MTTTDHLYAIHIRGELAAKGVRGIETKDNLIADRDYLLALVREQAAQIERVKALADEFDVKPGHRWASSKLRAALTATVQP